MSCALYGDQVDNLRNEALLFISLRYFGLIDPRRIVQWAESKVASDVSVAGIVSLASLWSSEIDEVDFLLEKLTEELDLKEMTERRAGAIVAADAARELNVGAAIPIDTANMMWRIARLAPSVEPELRVFIGLASEWEDDGKNREFYDEQIRAESLLLEAMLDPLWS